MLMMCHRIGFPPISTIGLGRRVVSSASRVPRPPASMITFIVCCTFDAVSLRLIRTNERTPYPIWKSMIETIRSVLAFPQAYNLFFQVIGAPERSRILVRDYIRPRPGDRILEIGCGPGTIIPYLPKTEYVGFDA